jgi:hypothetical protein
MTITPKLVDSNAFLPNSKNIVNLKEFLLFRRTIGTNVLRPLTIPSIKVPTYSSIALV